MVHDQEKFLSEDFLHSELIFFLKINYSRFMEWKSLDGIHIVDSKHQSELEPLVRGLLNKKTLLDVLRHFIVFEKTKEKTIKKLAAYHQYFAVNKAILSTLRASANGNGHFAAFIESENTTDRYSVIRHRCFRMQAFDCFPCNILL